LRNPPVSGGLDPQDTLEARAPRNCNSDSDLARQNVLFHHGGTEGTEISQRPSVFSVHLRVLSVSVVNKALEFTSNRNSLGSRWL